MHIVEAALRMFAVWLVMVLLSTWAGYPGVVCITPLAWLLALSAGLRTASRSSSPIPSRRIMEASLAGALLGLLQGALFVAILPFMGEIALDERIQAAGISLAVVCFGSLAAAALAAFNAWLREQRIRRAAHHETIP